MMDANVQHLVCYKEIFFRNVSRIVAKSEVETHYLRVKLDYFKVY